jgi:hypothetical protein
VWLCCGGCERRRGLVLCALSPSPPPISSSLPPPGLPGMTFEEKRRRHLWDQRYNMAVILLISFNNAIKQLAPTCCLSMIQGTPFSAPSVVGRLLSSRVFEERQNAGRGPLISCCSSSSSDVTTESHAQQHPQAKPAAWVAKQLMRGKGSLAALPKVEQSGAASRG